MSNEKMFFCYSTNLKDWFIDNGLPYISKGIHFKTNKKYWVFKGGRVLDLLLQEYRCSKD